MKGHLQTRLIGYCRYCGGKIFWNESEERTEYKDCDPDCYCELRRDEDDINTRNT